MMRALLTALAITFLSGTAQAFCLPRDEMLKQWGKEYAEIPDHDGLGSNGGVIEVWVSPTGTFTIILSRPNGLSCVMKAGTNWGPVKKKAKGEPA